MPSANASASEGDTVTITVSQGKKVSYAKMPNVLGLTEDAAKQAIKDQGLVPSVTYQSTSGTYGLVTAQGYNSGESLESGTTVTIVVSHYQKATEPATTSASTKDVVSCPQPSRQRQLPAVIRHSNRSVYAGKDY